MMLLSEADIPVERVAEVNVAVRLEILIWATVSNARVRNVMKSLAAVEHPLLRGTSS